MQAKPGMRAWKSAGIEHELEYCFTVKCELDSLHASEAWDEGLEWESYQFGRTVFSTSAGIEHELE